MAFARCPRAALQSVALTIKCASMRGTRASRRCGSAEGATIPTPDGVFTIIAAADQNGDCMLSVVGEHSMHWQPLSAIAAAGSSGAGGGGGGSGELDGGWHQRDAPGEEVWGLMVVRGPVHSCHRMLDIEVEGACGMQTRRRMPNPP